MRFLKALAVIFIIVWIPTGAMAKDTVKPKVVSALEAWEMLDQDPKGVFIIDTRPRLTYALLGHPPNAYNIPWRFATTDFQAAGGSYNGGTAKHTGYQLSSEPNANFVSVVKSLFKSDDKLIILSSYGEMSAEAAEALADAGFQQVYHVRHGFLGDQLVPKENQKLAEKYSPYYGERGRLNGWVFWGLPVSHKIEPRLVYPPDLKKMQSLK